MSDYVDYGIIKSTMTSLGIYIYYNSIIKSYVKRHDSYRKTIARRYFFSVGTAIINMNVNIFIYNISIYAYVLHII